jgi:hypothetical protein
LLQQALGIVQQLREVAVDVPCTSSSLRKKLIGAASSSFGSMLTTVFFATVRSRRCVLKSACGGGR